MFGASLAGLCAVLVWAGTASSQTPLPEPVPVADDALARAFEEGELSDAQYALQRARSLFRLRAVRSRFGEVAKPQARDATLILRDLALRLADLSAGERAQARQLLSRPTDSTDPNEHHYQPGALLASACDASLCFHWIETPGDRDAPPGADGLVETVPPWVSTTIAVFQNVWQTEVATFGYRPPLPDTSSPNNPGGLPQLDVYLADIGGDDVPLFGYCTTDDPNLDEPRYRFFAFSVYCVVDNDFLNFGAAHTPQEFLEVTAAHEFFHAIQFAYDAAEDLWLMEGTAVWMEDEVYPDINDNITFLRRSALTRPRTAVDYSAEGFEYGSWIFFRFLSEKLFRDPSGIRDIWTRADGSPTSRNNDYSLHAVKRTVTRRGFSFRAAFAHFGRVNRIGSYSDGALYPTPPLSGRFRLGTAKPSIDWKAPRLSHLSNRYYAFRPRPKVRQGATLRVEVDLPPRRTGPVAGLVIFYKSGGTEFRPIGLNRAGEGSRRAPFDRRRIDRVELVLTNASTRFASWSCRTGLTPFSCGGGLPRDDGFAYKFRAELS